MSSLVRHIQYIYILHPPQPLLLPFLPFFYTFTLLHSIREISSKQKLKIYSVNVYKHLITLSFSLISKVVIVENYLHVLSVIHLRFSLPGISNKKEQRQF
jgi:hypothetical protein